MSSVFPWQKRNLRFTRATLVGISNPKIQCVILGTILSNAPNFKRIFAQSIVKQFGLTMISLCIAMASGLTSGTPRGTQPLYERH